MTDRRAPENALHSELIRAIIFDFAPRFAPNSVIVNVDSSSRHRTPDVMLHQHSENRLFLMDVVATHGPIDEARRLELAVLFEESSAHQVCVSVFPTRNVMSRFVQDLAWESIAWAADEPTHLIHLNGDCILGQRKALLATRQ